MRKTIVLHIQHFVYPWRFPLFTELGERWQFDVFFCRAKREFRHWDTTVPRNSTFRGKILRAISIGPLTFNPEIFSILRGRYDVYSAAGLDKINLIQFLLTLGVAKIRRKPFIMIDEFLVTDYYRTRRRHTFAANRLVRKLLYRHIDAFVLWNKLAGPFVASFGIPAEKVFFGPQIMGCNEFGFRRKPGELAATDTFSESEPLNILYVGSLIERKAPDILLQAFLKLKRQDLRLLVVGEGPYHDRLRTLAVGDDRVRLLGHLEGEAKRNVFKQSHLFVLPSLHEPWGFVINEALEWGLPIITTNAVGAADYLVKDNGVIVPPGDIEALRDGMAALTASREALKTMSEASRRISTEYSISDMARPFLDAVDFTIANH